MPDNAPTHLKKKHVCEDCDRSFQKQMGLVVHRRSCIKKMSTNQEFLAGSSSSSTHHDLGSQKRSKKKARLDSEPNPFRLSLSEKALGKRKTDTANASYEESQALPVADSTQSSGVPTRAFMAEPTDLMDIDPLNQSPQPTCNSEPETTTITDAQTAYVPPPTRRGRERRFPKRYDDFLPCTSTRLPHMPPPAPPAPPPPINPPIAPAPPPRPPSPTIGMFKTNVNEFGMYRVYPTLPSAQVEENEDLLNVCDGPGFPTNSAPASHWEKSSGLSKQTADPFLAAGSNDLSTPNGVFGPFLNVTVFRLFRWFYSGSNMKSVAEMDRLVDEVIDQPEFDRAHIKGFKAKRILANIDRYLAAASPFSPKYGWKVSTVKLPMNCEGVTHHDEKECPTLTVPNVHHRSLVDAIKSALTDESAHQFHYTPFKQYWKPTDNAAPERVITDLYNSDAFYDEHIKLMKRPLTVEEANQPRLETAIAAMMLWSDSTHLADFGNASLWPIYLYFGNLSKYTRAKPTSHSAHHIAYIPSIPADLQTQYMKAFEEATASKDTISHLKRELMQAVWLTLLDDEFMYAYEHGIVITCIDGIVRRIFPRFFTYSADYPEKVLLATIKYLAKCPCPTCTTQKQYIPALGTHADIQRRSHERQDTAEHQFDVCAARRTIYNLGKGPKSKFVDNILGHNSSTPVVNAFSQRLHKFGFNHYSMLVPDLLHEFELGVWKAVFTHLVRILYSKGDNSVQVLNERFRDTPSFGEAIRHFGRNAAAMTKMPAREFEDLLQCILPVIENLLPQRHNKIVMDMLFIMSTWHGLAKLRLHTESTLVALQENTRRLGAILREFVKVVCSAYTTKDLPSEEAARARRVANNLKKGKTTSNSKSQKQSQTSRKTAAQGMSTTDGETLTAEKAIKTLNLFTYKLHALGHYPDAIRKFGTSDNFSTQTGELEHKKVKNAYSRTNKGNTFEKQIAVHHQRENFIRRFGEHLARVFSPWTTTPPLDCPPSMSATSQPTLPPASEALYPVPIAPIPLGTRMPRQPDESLPPVSVSAQDHYYLPVSKKNKVNVFRWVREQHRLGDLAAQNFIIELKTHLLSRVLGKQNDDDISFSPTELSRLELVQDSIYEHHVFRVNYTTYDLRRSQDSINPRTHCDIVTLSRDNNPTHPFSYARIIRSYHADITYTGPENPTKIVRPRRVEFLWVRWYELDTEHSGGFDAQRLHRLRFVAHDSSQAAFGFIDPDCVIRGIHILPAFAHGTTSDYLPCNSIARNEETRTAIGDNDYRFYYVNMFVDRDHFMRYLGGGVGHMATNDVTQVFRPHYMRVNRTDEGESMVQDGGDDESLFEGIEALIDLEAEEAEEEEEEEEEEEDDEDESAPLGEADEGLGGDMYGPVDPWENAYGSL
ncbi:hypothetical protein CVT24_001917 [Panaeolus cyanescens]|uniref:C2H2-type domain-containing protein n=1 Tax=Panaeolus cyanescens TaxID=181874 RepID=A0A409WSD3_9AGAR|nr:hypothetical protein CVT24_001917 [Panaeolus cyanescens]